MKKTLLLSTALIFSYHAHSSEVCSKDIVSTNAFNNFILIQEQSFNDTLKKSSVHVESNDDYIKDNASAEFDDCGALAKLRSNKIIRTTMKNNSLVNKTEISMDKKEDGWNYNVILTINFITPEGVTKNIMTQEIKGTFLTDNNGRINKSEDVSNIIAGENNESTRSVTTFLIDNKGRLSESNRVSTLKSDSVKTVYSYNAQNRLIKIASGSTTEDFTYGSDHRELSSKKVQTFSTTETTIETCKAWNEFGRCTQAKQDISILIPDNKGGKDHIYNHTADVKYDYVY